MFKVWFYDWKDEYLQGEFDSLEEAVKEADRIYENCADDEGVFITDENGNKLDA